MWLASLCWSPPPDLTLGSCSDSQSPWGNINAHHKKMGARGGGSVYLIAMFPDQLASKKSKNSIWKICKIVFERHPFIYKKIKMIRQVFLDYQPCCLLYGSVPWYRKWRSYVSLHIVIIIRHWMHHRASYLCSLYISAWKKCKFKSVSLTDWVSEWLTSIEKVTNVRSRLEKYFHESKVTACKQANKLAK